MTQAPMETEPLYSSLGSDPDLAEIVEMFVEEMPDRVAMLLEQLDSSDWEGLRRTAHQLKGAAGSFGFDPISPCAARLETTLADSEPEEQIRKAVDELVDTGLLKRVLARTDITFSNSLIESWWRVLKHQWLFLNTLDTVSALGRLVAFYVQELNTRLPHSAFRGQTPDEMYFGTGTDIPKQLEASRIAARQSRVEANRAQTCQACEELVSISS